jgi:hypothetical protein
MRGDLRQIYCKIQTGENINDWELWINRLKKRKAKGSIMIWQDAVSKSPVSVLCRNILLWLEMNGYFNNKPEIASFTSAVFKVRDVNSEQSANILSEAWDNSFAKIIKD